MTDSREDDTTQSPLTVETEKVDHLLFVVHGVGSHEERWKQIGNHTNTKYDSTFNLFNSSSVFIRNLI